MYAQLTQREARQKASHAKAAAEAEAAAADVAARQKAAAAKLRAAAELETRLKAEQTQLKDTRYALPPFKGLNRRGTF